MGRWVIRNTPTKYSEFLQRDLPKLNWDDEKDCAHTREKYSIHRRKNTSIYLLSVSIKVDWSNLILLGVCGNAMSLLQMEQAIKIETVGLL